MRFPSAALLLVFAAAACDDPSRPEPEFVRGVSIAGFASYPAPGQPTEESCALGTLLPADSIPESWSGTLPVSLRRFRLQDGQLREVGTRNLRSVPLRIRRQGTRLTVVFGGAVADSLEAVRDPAGATLSPRFVGEWTCPAAVPGALPGRAPLAGEWMAQHVQPID